MQEQDFLKFIHNSAEALWSASLNVKLKGLYDLLKDPQPGDYVLENTTRLSEKHFPYRFGKLMKISREPFPLDDEAKKEYEENGEKVPEEKVFYIELPNGTEYRWTNANFIKVLDAPWFS